MPPSADHDRGLLQPRRASGAGSHSGWKFHGTGRVGSGRARSRRVGSGRVGSGRVGSGRVGSGQAWRVLDLAGREGVTLARPDP